MYEIFLTAFVEDADYDAACSVVGGLCSMKPWESIYRILYFQGPSRPTGLSNQSSIEKPIRKNVAPLWKELHQNLSRLSFVVQAKYEIVKDRDMGISGKPIEFKTTPGILRWADFPDPPSSKPLLTQRKMVELWEQRDIPSILYDNNYTFKGESIEEVHRFYRDDIEFSFTRQYLFKHVAEYTPLESRQGGDLQPAQSIPAWDSLTPLDMQRRWILKISSHVTQDNKPDEIRAAQDRLMSIRSELEGIFDFKVIDRKVHDTRVSQQQQPIPALLRKV
ncbi:hypothetical protein VHEMI07448 [[Torrubiella] hemipterigena]|uniref:Mediator of RNA polymerase II transcription subunit 18 n=1 Tax=[Torrubiella] hemipterigena TaxID=1531966 RepID=A0A0A1T3L0_9HYPO|nr:hypothetical protein VHEMI07448 [[Torrubiella] hemipterigena]